MIATAPPKLPAVETGRGPGAAPARPDRARLLRPMRALFFRECWPVLPVAVCLLAAACVVAGILGWDIGAPRPRWLDLGTTPLLFSRELRVVMAAWFAVAGVILGVTQARRDLGAEWGFLRHRPAGSWMLFTGRMLAGLVLYGIAAGVPAAALVWRAFRRDIPFEWHYTLPTVADLMAGWIYYLAALVAVQRRAAYFGSRFLPLVMGPVASGAVNWLGEFSAAAGAVLACGILLSLAARGAQHSNGYQVKAPAASRVALGIVLWIGFSVPLVLGCMWGESEIAPRVYQQWESRIWNKKGRSPEIQQIWLDLGPVRQRSYVLLPDGTVGIRTMTRVPETAPATTAPAGLPISPEYAVTYERLGAEGAGGVDQGVMAGHLPVNYFMRFSELGPRQSYRELRATMIVHSDGANTWWFVEPAGLFMAYDASGRFIGSMGENGYAPAGKRAIPFGRSIALSSHDATIRVVGRHGYYELDFAARTIAQLCVLPAGVQVLGTAEGLNAADGTALIVLGSDRLYVCAPGDARQRAREVPLPNESNPYEVRIEHAGDAHRWAVWQGRNSVTIFDEDWQKVAQMDLPPVGARVPAPPPPAWYRDAVASIEREAAVKTGLLRGACDAPLIAILHRATESGRSHEDPRPWYYLIPVIDLNHLTDRAYFASMGISSLLAAVGMVVVGRRYAVRYLWAWAGAALVMGPVMILVLAALRSLPRRVACAHCGARAFAFLPVCGKCTMPLRKPGGNGTEVFAGTTGGAA
ncbi:MAG TPA: hypothetical protein VHM90_21215 [Phycisphaerae bacterium]|nr:hypothetical protein [Phycisphaerae bacterium]